MSLSGVKTLLDPEKALFAMAREAKRLPNFWVAPLVLVAAIIVGFCLALIPILIVLGDEAAAETLMEGPYGLIVPFLFMVGSLAMWVRLYEKRPFATVGFRREKAVVKYVVGFVVGFLMMFLSVALIALVGGATVEVGGSQPNGIIALGSSLVLLLCFVVQAGAEETLVRGWYLQVLGARYKPWIAVVVTSVVFMLMHVPTQPVAILNLLLFGLFTAVYCLREGGIWGVCGWHTAWNWAMMNFFGLRASGHEPIGGTLFDLQASGSPLLSGGDYGPEGSLCATLVFIISISGVILWARKLSPVSPASDSL